MKLIKIGKTQLFLFAVFLLAYSSMAPNIFQQNWESLMYAYWAEVNGLSSIWGNHPLGHVILNSIFIMFSNSGYDGKALPIHIICNSIFGGLAVAVFFSLMKIIKIDYAHSLGYTIIFGASYGMWRNSGSADIYTISALFLLLAWLILLYESFIRKNRYLYISGIFAGLSTLSHQLTAVFFLAALIVILSQKKDRWAKLVTFYGMSFATILVGTIIFGYIATSSISISVIYNWIQGYLGDPIFGNNFKIDSIVVAWKSALKTLMVPTYGRARFIRTAIYSFIFGTTLLGITQIKYLDQSKKIILLSAFLQFLMSSLLTIWFIPNHPNFWFLIMIPSMIILVCCIHALEQGFAIWFYNLGCYRNYNSNLLVIIGIVVIIFNIRYAILNEHNPDEASERAMNVWLEHSKPSDMLITAGDLIGPLWFWANRPNTVHLYHYLSVNEYPGDRFNYMQDQIDKYLCDGNAVIFAPAIVDNFHEPFLLWLDLSRDDLRTFFDAYQKERYFTYRNLTNGEKTQVYKLVNPNACSK